MGAQGTVTLDFGAFPGSSDANVTITGQAGIIAGSLVEAWILPAATADHSADEQLLETVQVRAGNIVVGTGFTVYGINTSSLFEQWNPGAQRSGPGATRIYGKFNIAWVWN
jgi:hypothetical protein